MNKNNNNSVPKSTLIWKNIPCISIHPYSVVLLFLFIKAHSSARKHTENLSVKDLIIGKISVPTKVLTRQLCSLQNNRNETITQNQNKGKEAHRRVYIHAHWCLICFVLPNVNLLKREFIFDVLTVMR